MTTEAARLSRILFEAREQLSMFADIVEARTGRRDGWVIRTRDEIDAYRAERGWSPHGYGGEGVSDPGGIVSGVAKDPPTEG